MKCQRCGEREAEVHSAHIVRTGERDEARTELLCTVCATFSANDLRRTLHGLLELMPDMAPGDRRHIEGMLKNVDGPPTDPAIDDQND
jgi:hypothetical protein